MKNKMKLRKIPNYEDKVLTKDEIRLKKKKAWLIAKGIIKIKKVEGGKKQDDK